MKPRTNEDAIFHVARGLADHSLRSAYFDQICAGDQALRERIEALLAVHEREQNFLKSAPAPAATVDQPSISEGPGQQIGRFKLLQEIGEGGFGVVYMAEQARPVRRKVALKVIKPGMDSKAVVARFEAERQALAMMDHENIARVLDGGATESGRPYFVMELVKGVPITEYCDQNHLPTDERLKLFISVCQAVQHAHQKGIIHRDLKPSNVLVTLHDGKPVVKVIDFGVAKAINQQLTEKTLFTSYGQMIGTPQYMSPEQAEMSGLDVDTRSDIYSLGVLLYELLTGTTPLESDRLRTAGYAEMQRLIREEEPPKPSTRLSTSGERLTAIAKDRSITPDRLRRLVRGDLDWVVMKALDKDRTRRYDTASSLADDVARFMESEPVNARAPSATYWLRKFVHRNKGPLVVGALLVAVLLTSTVITGLSWIREREARQEASNQKTAADSRAQEKTDTLNALQEELLDMAFNRAVSGDDTEVVDLLERAKRAGASDVSVNAIMGLALMHKGEVARALKLLDSSLGAEPNHMLALCAATWANYFTGNFHTMTLLHERLQLARQSHSLNARERLLLAQTAVFATLKPMELVDDLNQIIDAHPKWGLAYAIRAEARGQHAVMTHSQDELHAAVKDADTAESLQPDSPIVLAAALTTYNYLIEFERERQDASDGDPTPAERRAKGLADRLERWPDYLEGRMRRLLCYKLIEDERYEMEYQDLIRRGHGAPQPLVAGLLVGDDATALDAAVAQYEWHVPSRIVRAVRYLIDGDTKRAFEIGDSFDREQANSFSFRVMLIDLWSVARQPERAREAASRALRQVSELGEPTVWRCELWGVMYRAGEIDEDTFLRLAGPFHYERCMANFHIGMEHLARNELDAAKRHLAVAADCSAPGWGITCLSRAYLRLLEDGRLPITVAVPDQTSRRE